MYGIGDCNEGRFKCKTIKHGLQCISNNWRCDGKEHCVDGVDEQNCTRCNPVLFECKALDPPYKRCLDPEWRCDGISDCDLGDDEKGCNHTTQQRAPRTRSSTLESLLTPTKQPTPPSTTSPSYSRPYVDFRRSQSAQPTEDIVKGSNGTFMKDVQPETENEFESIVQNVFKSPYFVYGLLSTVVILVVLLVVVCVLKGRRKKRRRGKLPPIPPQERRKLINGSSSGASSSTTGSSSATTVASPDSHEYEDIEKCRLSVVLLAQTGTQQWGMDYPENITANNTDFETTDWTDDNSRRSSSYAAVVQFNNGQPSALTCFYEQPLKSQEQPHNEYLSIQEVPVLKGVCSGYEEPVSRKSYKEEKGKCFEFERCVKNLNPGPGFQTEYDSIQEVSVTESISVGYEEPERKASYKHDTNNNKNTSGKHVNMPVPLALQSEPCSSDMKSAQHDSCDDNYPRPINDDYIHPV